VVPQTVTFSAFAYFAKFEGSHPVVYRQLFTVLVPSIHNIRKDQMCQYNWVISDHMFWPLGGHPQAKKE